MVATTNQQIAPVKPETTIKYIPLWRATAPPPPTHTHTHTHTHYITVVGLDFPLSTIDDFFMLHAEFRKW